MADPVASLPQPAQPAFGLHTFSVDPAQAGTRLDRFLADRLPGLSRSRLQELIADGRVESGLGAEMTASRKVKAGELFSVVIPEAEPAEPEPEPIDLAVVYEDEHLIVIDKPAGMVVHPAPGSRSETLVNALLHHCGASLSGIGGVKRPGIVHRLDKDTSGLIVAAKTDAAHRGLARQFAAHSIERAYLAVCWGVPLPRHGEIEGDIGRNPKDRKKMAIVEKGGRHALTRYRVIAAYKGVASLVECRLATGRTHQIRVHMTSIGHPLIGDPLYGGRRQKSGNKGLDPAVKDKLALFPRQALHARLLGFAHPTSGEMLSFQSILPLDIIELITFLESL